MGLFNFFKKSEDTNNSDKSSDKNQREIARLTRIVGSKLSQDYDRQAAIQELAAMKSVDGVRALLKRFDFTMDPSITDREEKETVARGIVEAESLALGPVRNYCASAESLNWPLKVLRQIVPEDEYKDELLELLEHFDTEYVRNSEPKIQLIDALEEFPSEEVRLAVEAFLTDVNENVRFHAVGTVFACNDPAALEPLLDALVEEESLRVKNRIASGIQGKNWGIPETQKARVAEALPEVFELDGDKLVRRG